jgi:hypothetical protein
MADEHTTDADEPKPDSSVSSEEAASTSSDDESLSSREALQRGVGLLWRAARTAADEIQREVDTSGVKESLKQAGRELEHAAQEAAKTLEDFLGRGPRPPKPSYTDQWPPDAGTEAKQADADVPEDGGTDADGKPRDIRIQVEDD